ncbi:hypothetical protein J4727_07485 [Providencia rettgeri]|uniref:Uncharacterized protein n=1 Tax=Providencia rettgeri TaxID=587 RepID=A0A939NB46_PRORE|nr:hypothetical protein [Providencia rettgeri]
MKLAELSEVRSTKQVDGYNVRCIKDGIYLNDPRVCINELSAMMLSAHENISAINNGLKVRLYCGKQHSAAIRRAKCQLCCSNGTSGN